MASLVEYLNWRGDITFAQDSLNAVDALLLSQLTYLDLAGIVGVGEDTCTLEQAAERFWELHTEEELKQCVAFAMRTAGELLNAMAKTKRFSGLTLRNYEHRLDRKAEEQFSALEIVLGEQESFISFGGTDDTLVGWKEDFNLCFLFPIPSQTHATEYLERFFSDRKTKIYIGGHSKGGNLAVYSAVNSGKEIREKIERVYNFDGPGFTKDFIESDDYLAMRGVVETWVPESSFVGMLLEHGEDYQVVSSSQNGFLQHDATSWEVQGTEFIKLREVNQGSIQMAEGIKEWVDGLSPEELENFFAHVYQVLTVTDAKTLAELNRERFKSVRSMIHSFHGLDKKTKEIMFALVKIMITTSIKKRTLTRAEERNKRRIKIFGKKEPVILMGRK
ncbi:MAG: DUF2974 domain-containing protein [Lachnospiraceae bacterium]|nr:DUF2974 domain-containing protein [Lachnospiraceae bacterium]